MDAILATITNVNKTGQRSRESANIGVWLPALEAGTGVDVFTRRLCTALESLGYPVKIETFNRYFEPLPELLSRIRPPANTRVIIANSWQAAVFARPGTALISVFHNSVYVDEMWELMTRAQKLYHRTRVLPLENRAARLADRCVAPSAFTADAASTRFQVPVQSIYNGVDTELFRPARQPNSNSTTSAAPIHLLFVGKPSIRKGIDLVRLTMQRLGERYRLTIVGGRPGTKMPGNVELLGPVPESEVIRLMQTSDAMLFPSRMEGFGYAVAEAMACGLPVVALRRSATAELIRHGEDGLLCEDDPDCLADAVRRLAYDPKMSIRIAENARASAVTHFSIQTFAMRYHELIQRVLNDGG